MRTLHVLFMFSAAISSASAAEHDVKHLQARKPSEPNPNHSPPSSSSGHSTGSISPINVSDAFPPRPVNPANGVQPGPGTAAESQQQQAGSASQARASRFREDFGEPEPPTQPATAASIPPSQPPSPQSPASPTALLGIDPQCFTEPTASRPGRPGQSGRDYELEKRCKNEGKCDCDIEGLYFCENQSLYPLCSQRCECNAPVPTYKKSPTASETRLEGGPSQLPPYTSRRNSQGSTNSQPAQQPGQSTIQQQPASEAATQRPPQGAAQQREQQPASAPSSPPPQPPSPQAPIPQAPPTTPDRPATRPPPGRAGSAGVQSNIAQDQPACNSGRDRRRSGCRNQ